MIASEPLPHFVDDLLSYLYEAHPTHATLEPGQQCEQLRRFVMFVKARGRGLNRVPREQMMRAPRVFRRDDAHLAQHAQRARGDVLEVADRRGDHEESAGHVL